MLKKLRIWCRAPLTFETFKIEIKFEFDFKSTVEDEFKDVFRILVSWDLFDLEFSDNCNADYLEVLHQIDTIFRLHVVSNIPIVRNNMKDVSC